MFANYPKTPAFVKQGDPPFGGCTWNKSKIADASDTAVVMVTVTILRRSENVIRSVIETKSERRGYIERRMKDFTKNETNQTTKKKEDSRQKSQNIHEFWSKT